MNSLQDYGSDSDHEPAPDPKAGPSTLKRARSASSEKVDQDEDDVDVDAQDAFGLNGLARGKASQADHVAHKNTTEVHSAPELGIEVSEASNALLTKPSDTEMHINIPYKDMNKPLQGPDNPFSSRKLGIQQNSLSGHVESAAMNDFDFQNQHRTFENLGYARNPNLSMSHAYVGDQEKAQLLEGASIVELRNQGGALGYRAATKEWKKKRKGQNGDINVADGEGAYLGPWANWEGETREISGPSQEDVLKAEQRSAENKADLEKMQQQRTHLEERGSEKSVFHGKSLYDYQGRTYMHIPNDTDVNLHGEAGSQQCFLPKDCVHTWTGHTKAVSAIRLFPQSGHLLLSSSMDTKIKLWDVYHEGNCLRTFMGHSKAVKDVTFSNDGRQFLSASYDKQMKLWDTETGQCLQAFSNGKVPHVVKIHPDEDKQHIFLAGMNDKKIVQFDMRTNEVSQEYDSHLGAVNTITFVDENRRFVTTSDDKSMRAWDFDIPVVIKYISDPMMHSMPAVTLSPNNKWLACQSLDNQVVVYAAESFRQNRKKSFRGHSVAGYACQVAFSPDGRYLSSGDSGGNLVVWDWKTGRLLKRLHGHKGAVISNLWLPHETSKVITASWDGSIKLWD